MNGTISNQPFLNGSRPQKQQPQKQQQQQKGPNTAVGPHVGEAIVFSKPPPDSIPPPPEANHRAVHQIRLAALSHNYSCVESAATRQRCSVIVVVKADGYGHGAIESAVHLADAVGADAFAVATLEEGIALRKAFENTPPAHSSYARPYSETRSASSSTSSPTNSAAAVPVRSMRPPQIRILVLGPPVGYPRCFDDYYHHGIEVMCSGPEVAKALIEWLSDEKERKRTQVERAANDAKAAALLARPPAAWGALASNTSTNSAAPKPAADALGSSSSSSSSASTKTTADNGTPNMNNRKQFDVCNSLPTAGASAATTKAATAPASAPVQWKEPSLSATLGNVSGQDLAKEVRAYLMTQKKAKEAKDANHLHANKSAGNSADNSTVGTAATTATFSQQSVATTHYGGSVAGATAVGAAKTGPFAGQVFGGIEAAAKTSRTREMATARATGVFREDSDDDGTVTHTQQMAVARKRLRYHVLVDSGMGRLGFKTQSVEISDVGVRRDTVDVIHELVELEVAGAPIGKFAECTSFKYFGG